MSVTLFISEPDHYDGGELVINSKFGKQVVKLAAGDMVAYPSLSLHSVNPVTEGCRLVMILHSYKVWYATLQKERFSII